MRPVAPCSPARSKRPRSATSPCRCLPPAPSRRWPRRARSSTDRFRPSALSRWRRTAGTRSTGGSNNIWRRSTILARRPAQFDEAFTLFKALSGLLRDDVIRLARGVGKGGPDVIGFQVREVSEDFILGHGFGHHGENVSHPDAQPAYAGSARALVRLHRDAFGKLHMWALMPRHTSEINHRVRLSW